MTTKIRYVFYVAKFDLWNVIRGKRKPHLIDDGISLWTGLFNWWTPGYSHWEGWKPGPSGNFINVDCVTSLDGIIVPIPFFEGTCYTSTMRGKDNGTVKRPASGVFTNPERWDFVELEVTDNSMAEATEWADERVKENIGYGKKTILRFGMPLFLTKWLKLDDPKREICSEHGEGWSVRLWRQCTVPYVGIRRILMKILIRSPRRLWRDVVKRHKVATYSLATGKMVRDENGKRIKK